MFDTYLTLETPDGGYTHHDLMPRIPEGATFRTKGAFYAVTSSYIDLDDQADIDAVAVQYVTATPR
jgi:hypothetical protein